MTSTASSVFRASHPLRKFDHHGVSWEYQSSGRGRGALLLLGGELMFSDCQPRLVSQFEDGFRVIAPSYPSTTSVDALLDGLLAILDREELLCASIFGHGFGAALAHALARRAPARVQALALSGLGLCSTLHALELRAQSAALRLLPERMLRQHYEQSFARLAIDAGQRGAELIDVARKLLARHNPETLSARHRLMVELFAHPERYALQQRVEHPRQVLLLFANDDHVFSRDEQNALARTYVLPTVTRYLNGGHWVGLLASQEFERKLKLHFGRQRLEVYGASTARASVYPAASAPGHPVDADTLDWRQDRRLG